MGSTAASRGPGARGRALGLLIVRDLLVGPRRYGELAVGLPRIPSNILAARLKELQAAGVLRRVPHSRVVVYELTSYHRLRPQVAANLPAIAYAARLGPAELLIRVDGATLDVTRGDGPVDLAFAAGCAR